MDYKKHYHRLCERARGRVLPGYTEAHHIVPRCIGGTDDLDNIVYLTPEEHYLAHLLLVKIHPGNHRLVWAASAMANGTRVMARSNKMYGWLRRQFAERIGKRNKGRKWTQAQKDNFSKVRTGVKLGKYKPRTKPNKNKGRKFSEEHKAKLSAAKTGKRRGPFSEEHRRNLSASIKVALAKKKCYDSQSPVG